MSFRESVEWDLTASEYGGTGSAGSRKVHAQVRDAAGNWSAVFSDTIDLLPGG